MRLLFFKAQNGTLADKWNAWWSGGQYSRVQIEFADGVRFGVDICRGRAVFGVFPFTPENWDVLEIPMAEDVIRSACESYNGLWIPWWTWYFPWYRAGLVRRFGAVLIGQAFVNAKYPAIPKKLNASSFKTWATMWLANNPVPPAPPFPIPCPPPTPIPPCPPGPTPPVPPCPPIPPCPPEPTPCPPIPPYTGFIGRRRFVETLTWE